MHATARLWSLVCLCAACHRVEEPESSPNMTPASAPQPPTAATASLGPAPAPAPPLAASVSVAAAPSAEPPCVVPLADVPPVSAKPAAQCPKDTGAALKLVRRNLSFPEAPGAPRLSVELARSPAEHERGLMFRTTMPENHGMLFEWPLEGRRVFWMRNTCIPLDILFVSKDGTVAGVQEQVPTLNEAPRTIPCPAAYVLEVNAGWCRRHGVKPGMKMKLE